MRAACVDVMFETIKRWLVVTETLKAITKTPKGERDYKSSSEEHVDKTPSPNAEHVSFEIAMTQAKQPFMNQLSKPRQKATEKECFEIDTPSYKETDAVRLVEDSRVRDIDEALDAHGQEVKIGQDHDGVKSRTRATPHVTKSANARPLINITITNEIQRAGTLLTSPRTKLF